METSTDMNDKTNISFDIDLGPKGIQEALDEINEIAKDVDLFNMASINAESATLGATLLSRDRTTVVVINGQFLNRDMTDALSEITGGSLGGNWNHRRHMHTGGIAPGGAVSISSKTKMAKVMKYLGADSKIGTEIRKATAGTLLRITDTTEDDAPKGTTRVEVFKKDEAVEVSWDVLVKGMTLNMDVVATARVSLERNEMSYSLSFDYSKDGPTSAFKGLLLENGYRPFRGSIK